MENSEAKTPNLSVFILIWVGQLLSIFGSAVSEFGLTLWAYETTGKATPLTLIGVFYTVPMLALSPFVGVLVDRYNRKLMMMLSDFSAALTTLFIFIMLVTGNLQIWHLYVTAVITGIFQGFHWPAYSASISLMIPKKHYARANAMLELAGPASGILAPMVAGALIGPIGLNGLLIIDLVSAAFAIITLIFVHIPQPKASLEGAASRGNIFKESLFGLKYILQRPSLLQLQILFLVCNFFYNIPNSVRAPMILARTGNNQLIFGSVQSAAAFGGLAGGIIMGLWGGTLRKVHGVILGWAGASLVGLILFGFSQTTTTWIITSFFGTLFSPMINGSNQAIWQSKVPLDMQGRVFAIRRLIAWFVAPLANAIAGPLADYVFEPAMQSGGALSSIFSPWVGNGPGSGMSLMFILSGAFAVGFALLAYKFPMLREV